MAWALGAARIFFVVCGCAVYGWALGFGMGYRRGVDDAATHNGIRADYRLNGGTIKRAPSTSNGAQFKTKRPGGLTALSSILKDNLRPSDSRQ